jgi:hypothetical protein
MPERTLGKRQLNMGLNYISMGRLTRLRIDLVGSDLPV